MTKPPAFQFYPKDFKDSTDEMTAEEVGVYMRLICSAWTNHGLTTDLSRLARVGGVSDKRMAVVWPAIRDRWEENEAGRLVNPRQEEERAKQQRWRDKSAKGGRATAQAKANQ